MGLDNPTLGVTSGYNSNMLRTVAYLPHVVSSAVSVGFDGSASRCIGTSPRNDD